MPRPRVYVETTIPSAYFDERSAPEMVARREWTRRLWAVAPERYELVTGPSVLHELLAGPTERSSAWLRLLDDVPLLDSHPAIEDFVVTYAKHKVMPVGDAFHLAYASYYKCDFLLTWDFKHLANVRKFAHIRRVNAMLGLFVPEIVTPLELWGGKNGYA